MEIVCAGYAKTGTKTCSEALRHLGVKVADAAETAQFLSHIWCDYFEGKVEIEAVLGRRTRHPTGSI